MARCSSETPGRPTAIWSRPARWISGSETPSWSTRWRMMSTARSRASWVTVGWAELGLPWKTSSTPPLRSSPSTVRFVAMATPEATRIPRTMRRIRPLRRRSFTGLLLGRGEDEQQAAVVVVGREEVGRRPGRDVALGVDRDRLVALADAPLQGGADGVGVALGELQAEDLAGRAADHVLLVEAGELEGAPAQADDPALRVADEERGVGRRVVVVEELEEKREAALGAALGPRPEACCAFGFAGAVPAVRADEQVGHWC